MSPSSPRLETTTTGIILSSWSAFKTSSTSNPFLLGRSKSRMMASGLFLFVRERAASPSTATVTSYPDFSNFSLRTFASTSSSSTTRIFMIILLQRISLFYLLDIFHHILLILFCRFCYAFQYQLHFTCFLLSDNVVTILLK